MAIARGWGLKRNAGHLIPGDAGVGTGIGVIEGGHSSAGALAGAGPAGDLHFTQEHVWERIERAGARTRDIDGRAVHVELVPVTRHRNPRPFVPCQSLRTVQFGGGGLYQAKIALPLLVS